jgi:hypothetical protein
LIVARHFSGGFCRQCEPRAVGTAETNSCFVETFQPSLRDGNHGLCTPGVETPGYYQASLRDVIAATALATNHTNGIS